MDNPYAPPVSAPTEIPRTAADLQRLHRIAVSQRRVMLCVLGYMGLVVFSMLFGGPEFTVIFFGIAAILIVIAGLVSVVQLAYRLKGTTSAVIVGVLSLIPLVGLITLLVFNGWASKELKKSGFRIGLLGASPAQVLQAIQASLGTGP